MCNSTERLPTTSKRSKPSVDKYAGLTSSKIPSSKVETAIKEGVASNTLDSFSSDIFSADRSLDTPNKAGLPFQTPATTRVSTGINFPLLLIRGTGQESFVPASIFSTIFPASER